MVVRVFPIAPLPESATTYGAEQSPPRTTHGQGQRRTEPQTRPNDIPPSTWADVLHLIDSPPDLVRRFHRTRHTSSAMRASSNERYS